MPGPGLIWRHVTISAYGTWLHGDPRGFRSRGHRVHSSGDYRARPPEGEHAALLGHMERRVRVAVVFAEPMRAVIGARLVHRLRAVGRVLAVAVTGTHAHLLAELPRDPEAAAKAVGTAKQVASRAVRAALQGQVWSAGGSFKPVRDREHQRRVFRYIVAHAKDGAWVWTYREAPPPEEMRL